jgi:hypothetical protein
MPWRLVICFVLVGMGLQGLLSHRRQWAAPRDLYALSATLESGHCEQIRWGGTRGIPSSYYSKPVLIYRYRVDVREYRGSRFAKYEDAAFATIIECQGYVKEKLKQRVLDVWVSRADPTYSVIDPTEPRPTFPIIFIVLGTAVGLWAACLRFQKWRRRS